MARCSGCNQFASQELELDTPDFDCDNTGGELPVITFSVDARLMSECCSEELATATLEGEHQLEAFIHKTDCAGSTRDAGDPDYTYSVDGDVEPDDRYETTDRRGKPIKNPRYQRHYYIANASVVVQCDDCEEKREVEFAAETAAGDFEQV